MPHDIETWPPRHGAPAKPLADARRSGDASILILLGVFVIVDATLVILWSLI